MTEMQALELAAATSKGQIDHYVVAQIRKNRFLIVTGMTYRFNGRPGKVIAFFINGEKAEIPEDMRAKEN